ncbi:hypothetical protein [Actinoplanes nipponensis]|uniref:hypothetical protein n=1 Tax=Actinoplanes nipponensis TaxID=135950 RepID=UPI001941C15C|nr:hypothetical protein [Actinoplanes nipponensis]
MLPWLIVAVLVIASAAIAAATAAPQPDRTPPPLPAGYYRPHAPPPRPRSSGSGRAVIAVVVVTVLIVSIFAVRFAFGLITGRETGVDRLVEPVSATNHALTLTVDRVEVTAHFTRVSMSASNGGGDALTLPIYSNCQMTVDRTTTSASTIASQWPQNVPPESTISGVVVFRFVIPGDATKASLAFSTIFGSLSTRGSIVVRNIPLRPDPS